MENKLSSSWSKHINENPPPKLTLTATTSSSSNLLLHRLSPSLLCSASLLLFCFWPSHPSPSTLFWADVAVTVAVKWRRGGWSHCTASLTPWKMSSTPRRGHLRLLLLLRSRCSPPFPAEAHQTSSCWPLTTLPAPPRFRRSPGTTRGPNPSTNQEHPARARRRRRCLRPS